MSNVRCDIYDGVGLDRVDNATWILSEEQEDSKTLNKVHIKHWSAFADIPEFIKGKLAVLNILDADGADVEGVGMRWDASGFVILLTRDEIEELVS